MSGKKKSIAQRYHEYVARSRELEIEERRVRILGSDQFEEIERQHFESLKFKRTNN